MELPQDLNGFKAPSQFLAEDYSEPTPYAVRLMDAGCFLLAAVIGPLFVFCVLSLVKVFA